MSRVCVCVCVFVCLCVFVCVCVCVSEHHNAAQRNYNVAYLLLNASSLLHSFRSAHTISANRFRLRSSHSMEKTNSGIAESGLKTGGAQPIQEASANKGPVPQRILWPAPSESWFTKMKDHLVSASRLLTLCPSCTHTSQAPLGHETVRVLQQALVLRELADALSHLVVAASDPMHLLLMGLLLLSSSSSSSSSHCCHRCCHHCCHHSCHGGVGHEDYTHYQKSRTTCNGATSP